MRQSVFKKPKELIRLDRFEIVKRLGSGAMGLVYEVVDPRTRGHLALKTVRTGNPRALALFKREFRSLARVTHPNLVSLYELGRDGNTFFFTMELIRGVTLLRYLWGSDAPPVATDGLPPSPILDFERLRQVLSQLVASIAALHELGKLHRDIKPTNVMVTAEGRTVLMDFGFVSDQLNSLLESTQGSLIVGTPAFMPPEQSRAERLTAAADWYSVGATLYLALTGQPPYGGMSMAEVLLAKESRPPVHPRQLARGIPADLGDLCLDLLAPVAERRPEEAEIIARTGAARWARHGVPRSGLPPSRRRHSSTIGLAIPLTRLAATYADDPASLRIARIVAPSGQGKSRLVAHFLEAVRAASEDPKPLILRTRCNPGDAVPAQAIDDLVDGLARHLRLLDRSDLEALLPADAGALVTVFPVLSQVPALAELRSEASSRDAGFAALRHVITGLARLRPILLWVDDLQWSDPEGLVRLLELLAPPTPPPLMMILSYRSEETEAVPELARFIRTIGGVEIPLEPLAAEDAIGLAASHLDADPDDDDAHELALHIASEAEHSPLWIQELAAMVARGHAKPTLAELVGLHIDELPDSAIGLISLAAIAQRPLPLELATAAGISEKQLSSSLRRATAAHLVRLCISVGGERIAPFDDRVRTAILSHLDGPSLRSHHRRLAAAIEARQTGDPELLIHHLRGAGELDRAQRYALLHAEERSRRGDHLGAATLFRLGHELGHEDAQGAALLRRVGLSLAAAGHEFEAAQALRGAHVEQEDPEQALEIRLLAARLLLTNGARRAGLETLGKIREELGMSPIAAPVGTLSALVRRGQLRLRGTRYRERQDHQLAPRALLQVDAAWTASVGLSDDPTLAAEAQARHLTLALKIGEPARVGRAIALESLRQATDVSDLERAAELHRQAQAIAEPRDEPHLLALTSLAGAAIDLQRGLLSEASKCADLALLRLDNAAGCGWERALARDLRLQAAHLCGDLSFAREHLATWQEEASQTRSLCAQQMLSIHRLRLEFATGIASVDAVELGSAPLAMRSWPRIAACTEAALMTGDVARAWETIDSVIGRGKLHCLLSALAIDLRARAGLACGERRWTEVQRDQALLSRHPLALGLALSEALQGALEAHRGQAWIPHIERAAQLFDEAGLRLRADACRWRLVEAGIAAQPPAQPLKPSSGDPAKAVALLLPWPRSTPGAS